MLFHWRPKNAFSSLLRIVSGLGKRLPLMLRSTELNTFSMTKTIYRDLVCRANGGEYIATASYHLIDIVPRWRDTRGHDK